jgi:hypothetical protein
MAGRPSKATPEVVEKLATGTTIRQAAHAVGVSPESVKRWLRDGVVVRRQLRDVPDVRGIDEGDGPQTGEQVERAMVASIVKAAPIDRRTARFILRAVRFAR